MNLWWVEFSFSPPPLFGERGHFVKRNRYKYCRAVCQVLFTSVAMTVSYPPCFSIPSPREKKSFVGGKNKYLCECFSVCVCLCVCLSVCLHECVCVHICASFLIHMCTWLWNVVTSLHNHSHADIRHTHAHTHTQAHTKQTNTMWIGAFALVLWLH